MIATRSSSVPQTIGTATIHTTTDTFGQAPVPAPTDQTLNVQADGDIVRGGEGQFTMQQASDLARSIAKENHETVGVFRQMVDDAFLPATLALESLDLEPTGAKDAFDSIRLLRHDTQQVPGSTQGTNWLRTTTLAKLSLGEVTLPDPDPIMHHTVTSEPAFVFDKLGNPIDFTTTGD